MAAEPETANRTQVLDTSTFIRLKQFARLFNAIKAPLPTQTGDGTTYKDTHPDIHATWVEVFSELDISDVEAFFDVSKMNLDGDLCDDKKLLMERLIKASSDIPIDSSASSIVTKNMITRLYSDLEHPPLSYLGIDCQFRKPDGSYNNPRFPSLGAANTPYARSIKPMVEQRGALPDPGVIFDSIMAREKPTKHENKISSMLLYLAIVITHDCFRTDHSNTSNSLTSSYLDLSPLYGSNQMEQDAMRTRMDGKIHPDCFSETRVLGFPPGVACLLIMFNRFHNHVVQNLAIINEGGRFIKPPAASAQKLWDEYDENLFQTGRLITCGLYVNIILIDYVRTILNLNRTNSDWQLDPRIEIPRSTPVGQGNQVSAEFNLIYRWHAALSERDEEWTKKAYDEIFQGQEPSMEAFLKDLQEREASLNVLAPQERPIDKFQRGDDGLLSDDEVVKVLSDSIEDCVNAFGARSVPKVLKMVEVLGIQQARVWGVATLNEFRQHFGLKPYQKFEDMTTDPYIADQLKHLYDEPDLVELYPGLVVENTKPAVLPGSGLMPSNTVSRAILSDAVALVRGDRFYTLDYYPKRLTNWGWSEANPDLTVNHGCVFYKLFMRAFPGHFKQNSIYAHFPMTIPSEMKVVLSNLKTIKDPNIMEDTMFDFSRPVRISTQIEIRSIDTIRAILNDKQNFAVPWGPAMEFLMGDIAKSFMLAGDKKTNAKSRDLMRNALYGLDWESDVKQYYERKTQELIDQKKYELGGSNQIDIVRDVGNLVHVHFCSNLFSIPLKTEAMPYGVFTEHEMYFIMAAVFTTVFFDLDLEHSFKLRQVSRDLVIQLGTLLEQTISIMKDSRCISVFFGHTHHRSSTLSDLGSRLIERLLQAESDVKNLVWGNIMGTAGGMVANQAQLFAQMMDYYFSEGEEHLEEMHELAVEDTAEADDKLMHYMLEGSRLYCGSAVFRDAQKEMIVWDGSKMLKLKNGNRLFLNFNAASRDSSIFPDPGKVRLDRSLDSYIHFGWGPHQCLGLQMARVALTAVLKVVMRLPGLRTAQGLQGEVKKVPSGVQGYWLYMTELWDSYFPFPTTLRVNWDTDDDSSSNHGLQINALEKRSSDLQEFGNSQNSKDQKHKRRIKDFLYERTSIEP